MMILRLFIMLVLPAIVGGAFAFWATKKLLDGPLNMWRNRRIGQRNFKRLSISSLVAETCSMCNRRIDPSVDVHTGHSWIHKTCFEKMQKGEF